MTDLVREAYTVTLAAIHGSIEMTVRDDEGPEHAIISGDALLRAVVNLIVNARDAVRERASAAGPDFRPRIDLSVEAQWAEGIVEVFVRDNGAGIPEDIAGRILGRSVTTKATYGGSGLGLHLAREIARSAGGDLVFTTEVGGGSTFVLTLPLVAPSAPPE